MTYSLREDKIKDEENNEFTVYGIDVVCEDGINSFSDIFFDKCKAEEFVEFCRINKLTLKLVELSIQSLFE